MNKIKALRVHQVNDTLETRVEACTEADLATDLICIEVHYSSLNYKDALAVTGQGKILRTYPLVAGIDAAGVVISSAAPEYAPGDKVIVVGGGIGELRDGGYSERLCVSEDLVVPLPDNLTLLESMILGTAGFTAAMAIDRMQKNGQTPEMGPILVTGASGGVGTLAVNILNNIGYTVVALSGKLDQESWLREIGASKVLDRAELDFGTKPLEKAQWGGAIDNLGGEYLNWLCRTLKPWGNIASVGLAASPEFNTTVMPLILRGVSLLGINSVYPSQEMRSHIWKRLAFDLKPPDLQNIHQGSLKLEEICSQAQLMMSGQVKGRWTVQLSEAS